MAAPLALGDVEIEMVEVDGAFWWLVPSIVIAGIVSLSRAVTSTSRICFFFLFRDHIT